MQTLMASLVGRLLLNVDTHDVYCLKVVEDRNRLDRDSRQTTPATQWRYYSSRLGHLRSRVGLR
jgi:hypothetical protein